MNYTKLFPTDSDSEESCSHLKYYVSQEFHISLHDQITFHLHANSVTPKQ